MQQRSEPLLQGLIARRPTSQPANPALLLEASSVAAHMAAFNSSQPTSGGFSSNSVPPPGLQHDPQTKWSASASGNLPLRAQSAGVGNLNRMSSQDSQGGAHGGITAQQMQCAGSAQMQRGGSGRLSAASSYSGLHVNSSGAMPMGTQHTNLGSAHSDSLRANSDMFSQMSSQGSGGAPFKGGLRTLSSLHSHSARYSSGRLDDELAERCELTDNYRMLLSCLPKVSL